MALASCPLRRPALGALSHWRCGGPGSLAQRSRLRGIRQVRASWILPCSREMHASSRVLGDAGQPSKPPPSAPSSPSDEQPPDPPKPGELKMGYDLLGEEEAGSSKVYILGYDGESFEVGNVKYQGSVLAFPRACFLWSAKTVQDITPESLAFVLKIKPPIEVVLIGSGSRMETRLSREVVAMLTANGVAVEQMDTGNAAATFNILNQEDRRVVGALLALDSETVEAPTAEAPKVA